MISKKTKTKTQKLYGVKSMIMKKKQNFKTDDLKYESTFENNVIYNVIEKTLITEKWMRLTFFGPFLQIYFFI